LDIALRSHSQVHSAESVASFLAKAGMLLYPPKLICIKRNLISVHVGNGKCLFAHISELHSLTIT
jgi:hypothetical protein